MKDNQLEKETTEKQALLPEQEDIRCEQGSDVAARSADECREQQRFDQTHEARSDSLCWRKLVFGVFGIYASYLFHGSVEEDLFRFQNESSGHNFSFVWLLQLFESIGAMLIGLLGRQILIRLDKEKIEAPKTFSIRELASSILPFWLPGAFQLFAKAFTHLSLVAGISFPVVILAKSAKILPVMLGQLVLGESKFSRRDYLFCGLVVGGTAMLSMGEGTITVNDVQQRSNTATGMSFIGLSLIADGVTAGLQKRLKEQTVAKPPSTADFLLFSNMSMTIIACMIASFQGELVDGYYFLKANPMCAQLVMQTCFFSSIGQTFIYYVICHFDPLMCSTVTTTRKILSVLLSVAVKGHHLNYQGIFGLSMAVVGLLIEVDSKVLHHRKNQQIGSDESSNRSFAQQNDNCDSISTAARPSLKRLLSSRRHPENSQEQLPRFITRPKSSPTSVGRSSLRTAKIHQANLLQRTNSGISIDSCDSAASSLGLPSFTRRGSRKHIFLQ